VRLLPKNHAGLFYASQHLDKWRGLILIEVYRSGNDAYSGAATHMHRVAFYLAHSTKLEKIRAELAWCGFGRASKLIMYENECK
jgi:hypothetical protein